MPTPVSALLHAATLVTAGVYLLLRSSPILEYSPTALLILTFIGSTTAFVAASSGLVQNDLKRIVAFSTISQLGFAVYLLLTLFFIFTILIFFIKIEQLFIIINLSFILLILFLISCINFFSSLFLYFKNEIIKVYQLLFCNKIFSNYSSLTISPQNFLSVKHPNCRLNLNSKFFIKKKGVRNYSTPSPAFHKRAKGKVNSLNPWFITGFSDAESTFSLAIRSNSSSTLG